MYIHFDMYVYMAASLELLWRHCIQFHGAKYKFSAARTTDGMVRVG